MKIFIHIGDARTGTTTLQAILQKNRRILTDQNIDYPRIGFVNHKKATAQHKLAFSLMKEWPEFARSHEVGAEEVWGDFIRYLDESRQKYSACIISSEGFSSLDEQAVEYIHDKLSGRDVQIVFVRRDAAERRRSMREHKIRRGHYVEDDATPAVDGSPRIIATWERYFPVHVIDYDRNSADKVMDFCGVDFGKFSPVQKLNTQPPDGLVDLLNSLNKMPMNEERRPVINEMIWKWAVNRASGK